VKPETLSELDAASTAAAESSEPKAEAGTKPNFRKPVPDAMHYSLRIGERTFDTQSGVDYDQSVTNTFELMHKVLDSASALRDGRQPKGEPVCV
jgi:hypothetical protein